MTTKDSELKYRPFWKWSWIVEKGEKVGKYHQHYMEKPRVVAAFNLQSEAESFTKRLNDSADENVYYRCRESHLWEKESSTVGMLALVFLCIAFLIGMFIWLGLNAPTA